MASHSERLGLIAGNGKFPFLVLDAARAQGYEVVVAAIKEEASPEISQHGAKSIHWLSLGELKLIATFQREGVRRANYGGAGEALSRFTPASGRIGGWQSCCYRLQPETPIHCWVQ